VIHLLIVLRRKVAKPTAELIEANRRLAAGETDTRLDASAAGSREFEELFDSFNDMAEQIVTLRIEAYDMRLAEEENKLTMLRAQLKPHTFLNAITTISNMTYINTPEEIRAYIADFAKFVRYMLKTSSPWTTVEEEIKNIRTYLSMLERRSPGAVRFTAECPPEVAGTPIPYLLLFTLVENSIKHAMTLYTPMELRIACEGVADAGFRGVRLTVEDNGEGFPPEVIEKFLEERDDPIFTKEHLGLSNVRYTLNLVYRRRDLLRLSDREGGGARVEILIPEETPNEAADL
jgi:sensor histidine kinase YesM